LRSPGFDSFFPYDCVEKIRNTVTSELFPGPDQPRCNILPLTRPHFEKRSADQRGVIFDTVRNCGLYYDRKETVEVRSDRGILLLIGAETIGDEASRQF
jgi:hypothetical protein